MMWMNLPLWYEELTLSSLHLCYNTHFCTELHCRNLASSSTGVWGHYSPVFALKYLAALGGIVDSGGRWQMSMPPTARTTLMVRRTAAVPRRSNKYNTQIYNCLLFHSILSNWNYFRFKVFGFHLTIKYAVVNLGLFSSQTYLITFFITYSANGD